MVNDYYYDDDDDDDDGHHHNHHQIVILYKYNHRVDNTAHNKHSYMFFSLPFT
jgi:hypothetical protein